MTSREECLFDPLSVGLFDNDDNDDDNTPALFCSIPATNVTRQKSTSLFDDDDEDTPAPSAPAASSTGLFGDGDDDDDDDHGTAVAAAAAAAAAAAPAPLASTATTSTKITASTAGEEDPSDLLAQVDLSKISVVQKIDRSSKKKKKKAKATAAATAAKKSKNHGLLGADDDEIDLTLRPRVEEDSRDAFLLSEEGESSTKEASTPGLFDSDASDDDDGADNQKGGKSSGAYMRRMLTEDKPDDFDTDIADLSVAKMLTTEADTAGGLIEAGDGVKNVRAAATLAERTSDELLNVADDDDLAELMAATQHVSGNVEESAQDANDDNLFSVKQNDDAIDDDLFSMMGVVGADAGGAAGGAGAGDMSSIDAYISAQSGAGASLFD